MYISYALFPLLRASFMKLLYTLLTVRVNEPVCHLEELEAPQAPPLRAARTPRTLTTAKLCLAKLLGCLSVVTELSYHAKHAAVPKLLSVYLSKVINDVSFRGN